MQESPDPEHGPIGVPWSLTDMALGVGALVGSFLIFLLLLRPLPLLQRAEVRVKILQPELLGTVLLRGSEMS